MSKYRILFVDDDPDFRAEYRPELEAAGYEVIEADGEVHARELLAKESFDLAIVDLMMEKADSGFTLAFEMKKANSKLPIIMVSAVNSEMGLHFSLETEAERSWIKADAFLNKPIRFEQLKYELERLLGCSCCCGH
ncbi:MAG: response regulator [Planctomycetia bacterium]|nr:response regulator [Planctomycetia bacterium]